MKSKLGFCVAGMLAALWVSGCATEIDPSASEEGAFKGEELLDHSFGKNGVLTLEMEEAIAQGRDRIRDDIGIFRQPSGETYLTAGGLWKFDAKGKIDRSFGTDGQLLVEASRSIVGVISQTDGKIVVLFNSVRPIGDDSILLRRFDSKGKPDSSFGTFGKVTLLEPNEEGVSVSEAVSLVALPGERFLVNYSVTKNNTVPSYARVFKKDGSLDASIGKGGGIDYAPSQLIVDAKGRWLATNNMFSPSVYRFLPSGQLDSSFGTGGIASIPKFASALAVDEGGRVVIADTSSGPFGAVTVRRLTEQGKPDATFGTGGTTTFKHEIAKRNFPMVVDRTGRIWISYDFEIKYTKDFDWNFDGVSKIRRVANVAIVRLDSKGMLDRSFDGDGISTLDIAQDESVLELGLDKIGQVMMSGTVNKLGTFTAKLNLK